MYTDRNALIEYAFEGVFFHNSGVVSEDGDIIGDKNTGDGDLIGDEDEEIVGGETGGSETTTETETNEVVILETVCDIQEETALLASGTTSRGYNVYFPFDETKDTLPEKLVPGAYFRGYMYGLKVQGMVIGIFPTQMHGCKVEIRGTDI